MIRRLLIIFLILSPFLTMGQGRTNLIIGRVIHEGDSTAIPNVTVFWRNDTRTERTDVHGVFKIKRLNRSSTLIFQSPGKETVEINVSEGLNEVNVKMKDVAATAITASRWEQSIYETPASVVVISREEIERFGYISIQEILESVPGLFTIDHRSESDVTLGIRGFWAPFNRNVMIQVNGVNMLSERQNDFPFNKINVAVEAIDKIEIVRGPMSVIYGAGAFFGVINIITNEPETGSEAMASVSYGTQNQSRTFLRYGAKTEGFKLTFNASSYQRNGFEENWDDFTSAAKYQEDRENNISNGRPDARTISYYQGQDINKERYSRIHNSFNVSATYEGFSANVNYAVSDFGFSFLHPGPQDRNDYKSKTLNARFGYRGDIASKNFDYEIDVAVLNSSVDADYKYFYPDSYTPGQDNVASVRSEINVRKEFLNSLRNGSIDLDMIAGLAYTTNLTNNSVYNAAEFNLRNWYVGLDPDESLDTYAGYLQFSFKKKNLQLVAGGRLENQAAYKIVNNYNLDIQDPNVEPEFMQDDVPSNAVNFIPRLAVIYGFKNIFVPSDKLFLKGLFGTAIKQASVIDNAQDVMFAAYSSDSNSFTRERNYLKPEKIATYEIGTIYVNESKKFETNINLFLNDLQDLVTREASIINGEYTTLSTNGGKLRTQGVELIVNKRAKMAGINMTYQGDLTYQVTNDVSLDDKTDSVSFSPSFLGNINVSGSKGKVQFGLQLNYVGAMKAFIAVPANENEMREYIGEDTDPYLRFGMNFRVNDIFRFDKDKPGGLYFNLRGSNLFGNLYKYPTYNINSWADRGMPGRGRQILATLGYRF